MMLSSDQENDWLKDDFDQDEIEAFIETDCDEDQLDYYLVSHDLLHSKTNSNVKGILIKWSMRSWRLATNLKSNGFSTATQKAVARTVALCLNAVA
ncbi:hypothetical protein LB450_08570 [Psychroflexus sp. CAK1W]|uniref:hypothetical protein n=1 Tax=Psychroflexus curvus TaxID=2873595 RepID=UPI001CCAE010|nr:hypothetical protein [Psychroflexus curvus]MBZ9628149.1 hypothetical protein [Psychroflexus curvus]